MESTANCLDCECKAPKMENDYSLIKSGWRLTRSSAADRSISVEWRCPMCWAAHKKRTGVGPGPMSGAEMASARPTPLPEALEPSPRSASPPSKTPPKPSH